MFWLGAKWVLVCSLVLLSLLLLVSPSPGRPTLMARILSSAHQMPQRPARWSSLMKNMFWWNLDGMLTKTDLSPQHHSRCIMCKHNPLCFKGFNKVACLFILCSSSCCLGSLQFLPYNHRGNLWFLITTFWTLSSFGSVDTKAIQVWKKALKGSAVIWAAVLALFLTLQFEHNLSKSVYAGRKKNKAKPFSSA